MDKFWKASLAVGGLAAIGAFVFWSLYKDWLALPIFSKMTADQTYEIMKMFLCFTFSCFVLSAIIYATKRDNRSENIEKIKDKEPITENSNTIEGRSSDFILQVAPLIFDVIIFGEQQEYRNIKPWTDELRHRYEEISTKLRGLSIRDISIQNELKDDLNELADSIEKFINRRIGLGCNGTEDLKNAVKKATLFKESKIDPLPVAKKISLESRKDFLHEIRKLKSLNERSENMIKQGQIKKLQSDLSEIGHTLLRLSLYNTEYFPTNIKKSIYCIAKKIHVMETEKNFTSIDQESFKDRLDKLSRQLNELAIDLS